MLRAIESFETMGYEPDDHFRGVDRSVSSKEIPKTRRASHKILQDWLDTMPNRDEAIVAVHRHSRLSMSDIARVLVCRCRGAAGFLPRRMGDFDAWTAPMTCPL